MKGPAPQQRGAALAVALILLVVLTLLALSGARLSAMELRMAANDELRVAAFEAAQSLVDGTLRSFGNTPVLAEGVTVCARPAAGCTEVRAFTLPPSMARDLAAEHANVVIRGIPPLAADPPVGTGYSADKFDAAFLQVEGQYDQNTLGFGQAQVNEGIAIVYGAVGEITTKSGAAAETQFSGD